MKNNKSAIGYNSFVQNKATTQYKSKQTHKLIKCFECGKEGHFAHNCKAKPPTPLPKHSRPFAFNAHYVLRKVANGKVKVTFLNSTYVDWKTSLSRFNIVGPKPGKGGGLC
jgi:hypothetical protein